MLNGWLHRAVVAILGGLLMAWVAGASAQASYTLGVVPQFEPRKMFVIWRPIVDELEKRTGDRFNLVVALNVPEFEHELESGRFDFVYANPYHVLRVNKKQGYIPLVRDRVPLRGVLVVRRDSPAREPKDLNGKTLAVPSPNALGASLMVRADLEHFFGARMSMVNVKTHSSVYLNVLNRLTDAGGGVEKTFDEQDKAVRDALRVIYTTREMPSHPVAAHPRVEPEARERMRRALLEMPATPAAKALLDEVPMKQPVATSLADYLVMSAWGLDAYWISEGK